ncbi:MAG TPA: ribonuclease H-like domain-containing protein [Melioribacteraceae bacterium]|nr:ribonuclease H-like domain-containing protein [Melioribacteraceae bacterium]
MRIVLDIETAGYDFDMLTESQQEFILRYAEKEKDEEIKNLKKDESIRYLSLYPFSAYVTAIGILNIENNKASVFYLGDTPEEFENSEKTLKCRSFSEEEMLLNFWSYISKVDTVISFNGKNFDFPFLMLRSAVLRIKPSLDLVNLKKSNLVHIDLLEQFSYHNLIKKFNLDFYCNAFGINSPKTDIENGMEVKNLFKAGRYKEIANYCYKDLVATAELYKIWNNYLNI